jgi:hypothetical protein
MKLRLLISVMVLLSVCAVATAKGKNLVGNLRGSHSGCGCSFSFNKADQKADRTMFFTDLDAKDTWMNIDGQDVKLHYVRSHSLKRQERVGDRYTAEFAGDGITVSLVRIVTWVCPHKDEACEVTHYSATFTVRKGKRQQVVHVIGDCGC